MRGMKTARKIVDRQIRRQRLRPEQFTRKELDKAARAVVHVAKERKVPIAKLFD